MATRLSNTAMYVCMLGLSGTYGGLTGCAPDTTVLAYVASSANNHVQVIDLKSGDPIAKIYSGAAPWRLVQSPDHKQLWVQHWYSETTAVVDLASHDIKQVLPYRGPGTFTGDKSQFVTYSWPHPDLHVVDANSFNYVEKRPTEISRVYDLVPRSDGKGFWMTRFDPIAKTGKERHSYVMFVPYKNAEHIQAPPASYPTGLSPTRIVNSAYHPFSITADSETNGISIVNVLGDVSAVATCPAPQAVLLAPDEKQMVVACWAGYGVSKSEIVVYRTDFSARPWPIVEQTGAIKVDGALTAGRFHPGGASVLLVDRLNHQLMEFSVRDMKVAKTWPTGELPSDVELVTVTTAQAQKLARTETTGRQMLKKVLAQMQAARKPFADVSWVETRSEAQLSPLTKTASKNAPDGKKTEAAGSIRLQNYLKGPGRLRTEASNGVIRLAANGTMISILPDGRYWVTPRQELLPLVLGLPALSVDDAVRQLAGDVPGSLEMRSGIAVDVVTEIKDGHHGYFVIGAFKGGERVPQLWVDTETGLPTNMADKFPVVAARSGHDQTDFNGTVETKLYDFTQQEGKYVMPARMERVIDGKFTEDVKVDQVKIDSGLNDHQFDLARLGNVARKPKFEALTASKQAMPKAIPVAAGKEEYIQHPFQEHAPYVGNPPVRGIHLQYIADWGVYTVPIPLELQLHNLKDGGVALQYNCPDGCPDIVAELKKIAAGFDKFMLVAPYPLMDAKIALTAWGKLETLDHVDAARITEFIKSNIGINHHAH